MKQAKYELGDRIPKSPFVVRGIMRTSTGDYRYFIQVLNGDNTFVANTEQLENAVNLVQNDVLNFKIQN